MTGEESEFTTRPGAEREGATFQAMVALLDEDGNEETDAAYERRPATFRWVNAGFWLLAEDVDFWSYFREPEKPIAAYLVSDIDGRIITRGDFATSKLYWRGAIPVIQKEHILLPHDYVKGTARA